MGRLDRDDEPIIHRFSIILLVGAIEAADKGIEPQAAKHLLAIPGKLLGLIMHRPFPIQKIEIFTDSVTELALEESRPLSPTDHPHRAAALIRLGETTLRHGI